MSDKARLIEILNRNLQPWTFNGSEPFTQELLALLAAAGRDPLRALVEKLQARADKAHRDAKLTPAKSKARSILNAIGDTHADAVAELEKALR